MTPRVWAESVLAASSGALTVLTSVWPKWIEAVFGVEPDGGNGALEWLIVAVLLVVTALLGLRARSGWKRARAGSVA